MPPRNTTPPREDKPVARKPAARRPAVRKPAAVVLPMPSEEAVRLRAYHIWLESGCAAGQEVENWLQAERELTLTGRGR